MKNKLKFLFLGLSVASLVGAIVAMVMYFMQVDANNSIAFIEAANESIMKAKEMLDRASSLGWMAVILAIVTGALVLATVILFILAGRDKKKQQLAAQTTKEVSDYERN